MALTLYGHPFSSYTQKALVAFYENGIPFEYRKLVPEDEATLSEWAALWPVKRFPVLVDGDRTIVESSIVIEHLDLHYPGRVRFVPENPDRALEVRMLDRIFDNYIMIPMAKFVFDQIRPPEERDAYGVAEARAMLDRAYGWLDERMRGREWAAGETLSLADCAAAPSLFYADWVHPFADTHPALRAYRQRLLAWPSFARCVDEARPYRHLFPPGAPDRD